MCQIEKILCGLPKNGVAEHWYSELTTYISYAIIIMFQFVALSQIMDVVYAVILTAVWLLHVRTIDNLLAKIDHLKNLRRRRSRD